ncbi:MAG: oxygen-dependent coproporphyrinogen oxidase [Alphaproteobacteria bacterium]
MKKIDEQKKKSSLWFKSLRNQICEELEKIERVHSSSPSQFQRTCWTRDKDGSQKLGGGEMSLIRGKVFEKAGVNISTVFGELSDSMLGKIPGTENSKSFWASGISVVIHPFSPKIPTIHMNTRFIVTEKSWFGGGADITPTNKKSEKSKKIAKFFHKNLKKICDKYEPKAYDRYKKWCDEYFYLPHRKEARGLGGIFYDYLNSDNWNKDFLFTKNVGETFIQTYKNIVKNTITDKWNANDKKMQYHRRSRYVEFNLLHDRGTKFGLQTDGNIEAIFMSLPPFASW